MRISRLLLALVLFCVNAAYGFDRTFSVPLSSLKTWSENIVVRLDNVTIRGNSPVHKVADDCEMHFGASVDGYTGDPAGWVLEPMNICVVPFFGKTKQANADWTKFAGTLKNKKVVVEGIPRIWPEHLTGHDSPSNPNHAVELHPLLKIRTANKTHDFTAFIFAPDGFKGGLSHATAAKILEDLEVSVTRRGDEVEIEFDTGRIGNFTTFDLRISQKGIESRADGQRIDGEVVLDRKKSVPVRVVTVKGSKIHEELEKFRTGKRATTRFEGLVLFSLDPVALRAAAEKSNGNKVTVDKPLQLILYGDVEND